MADKQSLITIANQIGHHNDHGIFTLAFGPCTHPVILPIWPLCGPVFAANGYFRRTTLHEKLIANAKKK
jgi:hypothetical protein